MELVCVWLCFASVVALFACERPMHREKTSIDRFFRHLNLFEQFILLVNCCLLE